LSEFFRSPKGRKIVHVRTLGDRRKKKPWPSWQMLESVFPDER
jgi:hypothetical protein